MRGQTTSRRRPRPAAVSARAPTARVRAAWRRVAVLATVLVSVPAAALGTQAGNDIDNVASVTYQLGAATLSANSNTVTVTVAEVIDLSVVVQSPQVSVDTGAVNEALLFTLTNTGNGSEAFALSVDNAIAGDDFDPVAAATNLYFDSDGNGILSAGDTAYAPGVNDPVLAPDASLAILVASDIPAGLANGALGQSRLVATSVTGTGVPGTVFAGAGDGGVDAIVGNASGTADDVGEYIISTVDLTVVKSATVAGPFGGTEPIPGAQITYRIEVTANGTGSATGAVLNDPVPANTTYLPGSLVLNGAALTDVADADAGQYQSAGNAVDVQLGDLDAAAGTQVVEFTVVID